LSKDCAAEIKSAEIKTCQNLEKRQNLEPAEKNHLYGSFVNYIIERENITAAYTSSPLPVFIGSLTPFFFFFVYSDKITRSVRNNIYLKDKKVYLKW
jgi:hypothetical protein